MSGWYMNPQTGSWDYNPFAGAADYLQFNPANQQAWSDTVGGFISRTGRMPNLEEARQLAIQVWAKSDDATKQRAQQFAAVNGFWPTPFELEFGAAKDQDANQPGTGTSGQAGMGQVPVFVPGIGVTLIQGSLAGNGGLMFDPFSGVPDSVRPWVREVLNGSISIDQLPTVMGANGSNIMRDWVNFALSKFQENIPRKMPSEIPWGEPGAPKSPKDVAGPGTPGLLPPEVTKPIEQGGFEDAWRQYGPPGQPLPTQAQLTDPSFVSQLDLRLIAKVPTETLKRLPNQVLMSLPNDVLISKLDIATLAKFPNERWTGEGQWKGSGFDSNLLLQLPDDRLKSFSQDYLDKIVTDVTRRKAIGLPVPETPATTDGTVQTAVMPPLPAQIGPTTTQAAPMPTPLPTPVPEPVLTPAVMPPPTVTPTSTVTPEEPKIEQVLLNPLPAP
jgi:hypothetical protein